MSVFYVMLSTAVSLHSLCNIILVCINWSAVIEAVLQGSTLPHTIESTPQLYSRFCEISII